MCFSPLASFAAGTLIATIGGATLEKARKNPSLGKWLLALIPMLFAIQQFIEGIAWLCLQYRDYQSCQIPFTNTYLLFAGIIWLIWFPLSCLCLEKFFVRKLILGLILTLGIAIAIFNLHTLMSFNYYPIIINHSLFYEEMYPEILLYGPVIVLPFLISSRPKMWIVGILLLFSLAVTLVFFFKTGCSVWCFFSAIASIVIYAVLSKQNVPSQHTSRIQ